MDSDVSRNGGSEDEDLGFAFNDSTFSDRIIRLEILKDVIEVFPNNESSSTSVNGTSPGKSSKEDKDNDDLLSDKPDVDNCSLREPREDAEADAEENAMVVVSSAGDEAANVDNTANFHMDYSAVVKVKTLYVISSILAVKSLFFYKLFSNGMKESKQTHITVRITASEEVPFMELLKFMYSSSLYVTFPPKLLDILMVADKFGVVSCMTYCIRVLLNIPMTPESALLYLDLPYSVLMTEVVWPLSVAAKEYLVARYKDIIKHQEELMGLPLAGIVALLSSDELQVAYEDEVYDFVLKWAQTQYPRLEERRQILEANLIPFIRFPYMTCRKLKMVMTCNEFDHNVTSKLVFDALYFKAEAPHRQRILAAELASTSRFYIQRSYMSRPIKVVEFELPHKHCVVYLYLKREECANLFPSGRVCSQAFHLGGHEFFLSAQCNMGQQTFCHCFGLLLTIQGKDSANLSVDYEFSVRSRPTLEYTSKYIGNFISTGVRAIGYRNIFCVSWKSFMAEDSVFFINDVLHLRVEVTIKNQLDLQ